MDRTAPLIVTLALDDDSFAFFDEKRRRFFPRARNVLSAHLTLFHRLPGAHEAPIATALDEAAAAPAAMSLHVTGLRPLGRGVAYALSSPELEALRAALAARWTPWLTPQDRQRFQPHVTIQNMVEPSAANALLKELQQTFSPFTATGEGLQLWRYRDGPWEPVRTFPFRRPT